VNFVADEGIDRPIVERLRQDGHAVFYVAELSPGVPDEDVLEQANARNAVLLTADKDFGELVYRQRRVHAGVVLLRLAGLSNETKATLVAEVCRDRTSELVGAFSVAPDQVRIRQASGSP
jgi:predicted nuclease of predicted toxin-antitoxin system